MQGPCCHLVRLVLCAESPTVGDLMALCEENFRLLMRLAPWLREERGALVSRVKGGVDLHLRVEEQSRYTTTLRLTHYFAESERPGLCSAGGADPNALLRVYHDARQVEVLDLRQTILPRHADYRPPALDSKWRTNLFLSKWLAYCLQQGHSLGPGCAEALPREDDDLLYTLS